MVRKPAVRELITIPLLLGGILLGGIGWLVGVGLLWSSPVWRLRDKLLGTLLIPGGLPMGILFAIFGVSGLLGPEQPSGAVAVVTGFLQAIAVMGPLYTTVHLARRWMQAYRWPMTTDPLK